jgi:hypothetical protein
VSLFTTENRKKALSKNFAENKKALYKIVKFIYLGAVTRGGGS